MSVETERKFLVCGDAWKALVQKRELIRQGYICRTAADHKTVRVRIRDGKGFLTLKAPKSGVERFEYEYEIPVADAGELLDRFCVPPLIEKYRNTVPVGNGLVWEIDEFLGDNAPLVLAEIELPDADAFFELPDWIGKDVSDDVRYYNSNLIKQPYSCWKSRG